MCNNLSRNDEETENLKLNIIEETDRLTRLQNDRSELSSQIDLTLLRLYGICVLLKEADNAPVPEKCPSIDKADWLICLLQTKYENVTRSYGIMDSNRRDNNVNEEVKNGVCLLCCTCKLLRILEYLDLIERYVNLVEVYLMCSLLF